MRTAMWLAVFLMFGLVVMSRSSADPDLWGHVTYGREVLRDGYLHDTTTWSYAIDGYRWVNHENIAELSMAAMDLLGGQTALLLMKSVLTLVVLGLPVWMARRMGAGLLTCLAIVVLLSFNISFHWLVRPHIFSYACAAALLCLLATSLSGAVAARNEGNRSSRGLWLIPALMCFWTNAHGGYLAGLAILTAWLGLDAIDLLLTRNRHFWSTVRHHAILWTATVTACMLNPYGLELHTWMLSSLGRPRPEIDEWGPLPLFSLDGMPFWCLALTCVLCLKKTKLPLRWPGLLILALLTWQAVKHHRHLPFVSLLAVYLLVPHLDSLFRQMFAAFEKRIAQSPAKSGSQLGFGEAAMISTLLVVLAVAQYPRQSVLKVPKNYYPVSAMQYMADQELGGRVFVTFNWAQYALAVFADSMPDSRIAFDGRFRTCYPQHIIDLYFDFILGDLPPEQRYREPASGPFDPTKALQWGDPNLVLFETQRHRGTRIMQAASDEWCLLYQDSLAQLWGRRSVYDDQESDRYFAPERRVVNNQLQQGIVAWPAFPKVERKPLRVAANIQ